MAAVLLISQTSLPLSHVQLESRSRFARKHARRLSRLRSFGFLRSFTLLEVELSAVETRQEV